MQSKPNFSSSFLGNKLKPRPAEVLASQKEDDAAVINMQSPADINTEAAYRVLGQPVSKGA
jgi:hypothetical protein